MTPPQNGWEEGLARSFLTPMEHLPARRVGDPDDMPRCVACGFMLTPRSGHQRECPVEAYLTRLAAARGEPEIDVERLARALDAAYDDAVVHCRCGKTILLDNWPNHRNRKSGRPHRPLAFHAAVAIATEYNRLAIPTTPEPDQ